MNNASIWCAAAEALYYNCSEVRARTYMLFKCAYTWFICGLLLLFTGEGVAYHLLGTKWPTPEVVVHVDIRDTLGRDRSPTGITWSSAFGRALLKWIDSTSFNFLVVPKSHPDPCLSTPEARDGKNSVGFATSFCSTSFGATTIAVTQWTFIGEHFVDAAIIFNDQFTWDVYSGPLRSNGEIDFSRVAVHETGHLIGLDHENVAPSIMLGWVANVEKPQQDDINGVHAIYGSPPPSPPPIRCAPPFPISSDTSFNANLTAGDCNIAPLFGLPVSSYADIYMVTVTQPGHLVVRMSAIGFDTFLFLLDAPTMKPIDLDDDGGGGSNSMIVRDLAEGDYAILATSFNFGVTGSYALSTSFSPYSVKRIDQPPNAAAVLSAIISILLE